MSTGVSIVGDWEMTNPLYILPINIFNPMHGLSVTDLAKVLITILF